LARLRVASPATIAWHKRSMATATELVGVGLTCT